MKSSCNSLYIPVADSLDKRTSNRKQSLVSSSVNPSSRLFLTASQVVEKETWGEGYQMVLELHKELDDMVEEIGTRVATIIDRSESEFVIAYRNHMKKIRVELEDMRARLQLHQSETSVQKVSILEKQLRLFREESLKMYDKLENKNKLCDEMTLKLGEMKQENLFLQGEVKKLMKANKILQMEMNKPKEISIDRSISEVTRDHAASRSKTSYHHLRKPRLYSSRYQPRIQQISNDQKITREMSSLLSQIVHEKDRKIHQLQSKSKFNQDSTSDIRAQSQLETFFLECVETVRKDIYKKQRQLSCSKWEIIDFSVFKGLDQMRVLKLFVGNEKALRAIYKEIFVREKDGRAQKYMGLGSRGAQRINRAISTCLE